LDLDQLFKEREEIIELKNKAIEIVEHFEKRLKMIDSTISVIASSEINVRR